MTINDDKPLCKNEDVNNKSLWAKPVQNQEHPTSIRGHLIVGMKGLHKQAFQIYDAATGQEMIWPTVSSCDTVCIIWAIQWHNKIIYMDISVYPENPDTWFGHGRFGSAHWLPTCHSIRICMHIYLSIYHAGISMVKQSSDCSTGKLQRLVLLRNHVMVTAPTAVWRWSRAWPFCGVVYSHSGTNRREVQGHNSETTSNLGLNHGFEQSP